MKKTILLIFLFSICLLSCTSQKTDDYDVYLLIGQSNMAGRGQLLESDRTDTLEGVWLLDAAGCPEPATAPLNRYSTIGKPLNMQGMNPGVGFSKTLYAKTGKKILLVCNSRGGSSLKQWMPEAHADTSISTSNFFNEAVKRAQAACQYGELKGILWHQGESDSGHPGHYLDSLSKMVSRLRTALGDENAELPFVAGEIAPWHKNRDRFNPVINALNTVIPNSACVSSEGCTWLKNENDPHFSREAQLLLGRRYAEKIYSMTYEN